MFFLGGNFFQRIEIQFKLLFDQNFGAIKELRLPSDELTPGARNYVNVVMELIAFEKK